MVTWLDFKREPNDGNSAVDCHEIILDKDCDTINIRTNSATSFEDQIKYCKIINSGKLEYNNDYLSQSDRYDGWSRGRRRYRDNLEGHFYSSKEFIQSVVFNVVPRQDRQVVYDKTEGYGYLICWAVLGLLALYILLSMSFKWLIICLLVVCGVVALIVVLINVFTKKLRKIVAWKIRKLPVDKQSKVIANLTLLQDDLPGDSFIKKFVQELITDIQDSKSSFISLYELSLYFIQGIGPF